MIYKGNDDNDTTINKYEFHGQSPARPGGPAEL